MKYEEELNAGYILSLQKIDNQLSVKQIAIDYPKDVVSILNKLEDFEESLEFYDVFDVEHFVERSNFDKEGEYKYCWPYEYYQSFKPKAKIEKIDRDQYYQKMEEIEERISLKYVSKLKPKRWLGDHWEYLDEWRRQELEREKREEIRKRQEELKQEILQNYIITVRRYICAQQYMRSLRTIKDMCLMYSSDARGWYEPDYNITENAKIGLRTNFCFGNSAYFNILLTYKGISILPYSDLVKYYWSNMMDNMRCTRSYTVHRRNWPEVLSFVAEICNWIERDSVSFEKKWIVDEVESMMDGLKDVHERIEAYYNKLEDAKREEDEQLQKTILYRNITESEISQHNTYPHETLLNIQTDKLAAALSLLENLTRLKSIYTPIVNHINTIVKYNKEIVPAIKTQCDELKLQISKQVKEVEKVEKSIKLEEKKLEIRENEIVAAFEASCIDEQNNSARKIAKTELIANDKEYRNIKEHISELKESKSEIEKDISQREGFKMYLEHRLEYITEYLKQWKNGKRFFNE